MARSLGAKVGSWTEKAKKLARRVRAFASNLLNIGGREQSRREAKRPVSVLRAVTTLATAAFESLDPDEVLARSLRESVPATGMDAGMIYLMQEGDERLAMVAHHDLPEGLVNEMAFVRPGEGPAGRTFLRKEVLAIRDLRKCSYLNAKEFLDRGCRSFLGAPIICGGEGRGVIALLGKQKRAFSKLQSETLGSIARIVGTALEKALAYGEMQDALVGMRRLSRVASKLAPRVNLNQNLEELARLVSEATLGLSSMIVLLDEQGTVVQRAVSGYTRKALASASQTDAISARVLRTTECVVLSDPWEIRASLGEEVLEGGFERCVCLPLRVAERAIGALWLNYETPRKLAGWEIEQLQSLADRVAAAVENSRLESAVLKKIERYRRLQQHFVKVSSPKNLKDALQRLADSARELVEARTAVVSFTAEGVVEQAISTVSYRGRNNVEGASRHSTAGSTESLNEQPSFPASAAKQAASGRMRGSISVPLLDEGDEPVGMLMVTDRMSDEDFTEDDEELLDALAKHAMLAIRNAGISQQTQRFLEEYRALLDRAPVAMITVNKEQIVTSANKKFEELTGFTKDEIEGKMSLWDFLPEAERAGGFNLCGKSAEDSLCERESEAILVRKSAERKKVRVTVGEVQDSGSMAIFLTEPQARASETAARDSEEAPLLQQIASSVLVGLHEPLAAATEHLAKLIERQLPEGAQQSLRAMCEQVRLCRRKLEQFKILAEPLAITPQPVRVNDLITSAVDEKGSELRRDNVGVVVRLDADMPAVPADPDQLRWVLGELIENCRKAMQRSLGDRTLAVQTERKGGIGRVSVSDTRPDAQPEPLRALFQLPSASGGDVAKTDLGLAACRAIIERLGWRISAESHGEEGIVFVIEYSIPEELIEEERSASAAAAVESPLERHPQTAAAGKVLIIDDEAVVVDLLDYFLRSEGHDVETSRDGRDGLKKLKENDYSLIFCDVKMPGLGGQELFRWLEANKPDMAQRVIFITGDVSKPETVAFLKDPPKRWLEKPFDLTELRQVIAEVLQ